MTTRRQFIRGLTLGAAGIALGPRFGHASGTPAACSTTTPDILGPFYAPDAPMRTVLASLSEAGTRLVIQGTAYANDCSTPLPNVMIDIWGANDAGCYSRFGNCDPAGEQFNLRGRMLTDSLGRYSFETVKPGKYLNGSQYRPSHVHYQITLPGGQALVTQLYFTGDNSIAADPWASDPKAANRIIPLATSNNILHGTLDLVLDVKGTAEVFDGSLETKDVFFSGPNPFGGSTNVVYTVAASELVEISIYDLAGNKITTLTHAVHAKGMYTDRWNGTYQSGSVVPNGVYLCVLHTANAQKTIKIVLER